MEAFRHLISHHEDECEKLHSMVRETFQRRNKSELAWRDWQLAAKRFREYRTDVDQFLERCLVEGVENVSELRTFAFCFIECDPYYYRSGYAMEALLRKIKKLSLTDAEQALLKDLILKRIDNKALRNFRQICRFIPMLETLGFSNEVAARTRSSDPSVRHRANFALSYFPSNSKHKGAGFVML
ncbi:hypothetical protein [Tateyamaria sp.]|uniref:hypothetical protein n=1 Tax=Tateyamaria sp. TaxID=1929288 RepID=UPI0032A06930